MRNQNGVTLIALVVTIIILIILASVSISNLIDEDKGVVAKAKQAAMETEKTAEEEDEEVNDILNYKDITYSVKFVYKDSNGYNIDKVIFTDTDGNIDTSLVPTPTSYTASGYFYTFEGWEDSSGNVVSSFSNISSNKTVTAVYTSTVIE